jgi:hypothetical protein
MDPALLAEPEKPDYYEDLGLRREATVQEIKLAFRKLARLHHPDKKAPGVCIDAQEFRKASGLTCIIYGIVYCDRPRS